MICLQQNYVGKQVIIQMNVIVNSVNTVTNVAEMKIKTNKHKVEIYKRHELIHAFYIFKIILIYFE